MIVALCAQCLGLVSPTTHGSDCPCGTSGAKLAQEGVRVWGNSVVISIDDAQLSQVTAWHQPRPGKAAPSLSVVWALAPKSEYRRVPYPVSF